MSATLLQFHPKFFLTVAVILSVVLFCALGFWQLDRAAQKRSLADLLENRRSMPPARLDPHSEAFDELEYRRIVAKGRFYPEKQILIENRKHLGKSGFHVVSPLRVEGTDRYLLVNRGWVAAAPDLGAPVVTTPDDVVEVVGEAVIPAPPALDLRSGDVPSEQKRWPFITLDGYAAWSGLPIYPLLLLQSGENEGFVRAWNRPAPNDTMHIGYAIQWFAFALIVLAIWLKLSVVRSQRPEGSQP